MAVIRMFVVLLIKMIIFSEMYHYGKSFISIIINNKQLDDRWNDGDEVRNILKLHYQMNQSIIVNSDGNTSRKGQIKRIPIESSSIGQEFSGIWWCQKWTVFRSRCIEKYLRIAWQNRIFDV